MSPTQLLDIARQLADAADEVTMRYFRDQQLDMWSKTDGSRVTEADTRCEEAILRQLRAAEPGAEVLAEESGGSLRPGERWVIDPIDGTENFSRGNPIWGTLIAREVDGEPAVAMISAPALGQRWWAVRGVGAYSGAGERLRVSSIVSRDVATFCYGGLHECPTPLDRMAVTAIAETFRCGWGWGNFWAHVLVAQGSAELALSYGVSLWDVAAPALLVEEAGGGYTDVNDRRSLTSGTLVTHNGHFAGAINTARSVV